MTLAVKLLCVVSRDTPAKGEHATAAPAHVAVAARPWVADLYAGERSIDRVIPIIVGLVLSIALAAVAMGMQSASIQHLAVSGISTNVVTSTLTAAVTRLVNVLPFSHPAGTKVEGPQLHLSCWCSYLLGAVVGGVTSQIGLWAPFGLSVFLVLAVVSRSQHAIKQT